MNPYAPSPESAQPETTPTPTADPAIPSAAAFWTGWVLSVLPAVGLILSATLKFVQPGDPKDMAANLDKIGWKLEYMIGLGILELTCALIYLFPRTSMLGAILVTGYMGGAIATHIRIGDFMIIPHVILGVLIWLGLFLRDPRLQSLIPVSRY